MEPKKSITGALGKIKSLFFNLTQEGRVGSDELEDFNHAMQNAWASVAEFDYMVEAARGAQRELTAALDNTAAREKKLRILCSILGMHHKGIDIWLQYPVRFVSIINSQLRKANQPVYSENYFVLIWERWNWLNSMIDVDMGNARLAVQMRDVYNESGSADVRAKSLEIMRELTETIGYLQEDIKKGKRPEQLLSKITNHWYDELSAYYPAVKE